MSLLDGLPDPPLQPLSREEALPRPVTGPAGPGPSDTEALLAYLAHELRTPLQIIAGLQELLADAGECRQPELVARLEEGYARLSQRIGVVLDAAGAVGGGRSLRLAPVCLATVVGDLLALLAAPALGRGVTLARAICPALPLAYADEGRLGPMLGGLLEEALAATPAGEEVLVRSFQLPGRVGLAIDAGGARAPALVGGGLFLARRLIEAQGGLLGRRATRQGGYSLWLTLPAYPDGR